MEKNQDFIVDTTMPGLAVQEVMNAVITLDMATKVF